MYNEKNFKTAHPLTFGLSMVAGVGVVLMILSLAFGVLQSDSNTYVIGMTFVGGLLTFISGIGAWMAVTRPFTHFDDINQPAETDHGHAAHDADMEHAIVPADSHDAAPHTEHH